MSSTRERILEEATRLVSAGHPDFSMADLARRVGISRQALYLHFATRDALLLALVDHVDRRTGLTERAAPILEATTGTETLRLLAALQAEHNPLIAPVARAVDSQRHRDPSSDAAWRDRTSQRLAAARMTVDRLVAEGRVHPAWDREEAALVVWELTSFRVWDDLVTEAGLASDRYVELVVHLVGSALSAPPQGAPQRSRRAADR